MSAGTECEVAAATRSASTLEFGGGVRLPGLRVGDRVGVGHPAPALRAGVGRDGAGGVDHPAPALRVGVGRDGAGQLR